MVRQTSGDPATLIVRLIRSRRAPGFGEQLEVWLAPADPEPSGDDAHGAPAEHHSSGDAGEDENHPDHERIDRHVESIFP